MDLKIIEELLEEINKQSNQLIDLVRALKKGDVFGELMSATLQTKLITQAKSRYIIFIDTITALTSEINK